MQKRSRLVIGAAFVFVSIEFSGWFDEAVAQGKLGTVSADFEALTGRKPTRVADFLAAQTTA